MSDDDGITKDERVGSRFSQHRVLVLVGLTIIVTIIFTAVGMMLYSTSGTAQLDLSRPDYKGVNEIVEKEKEKAALVDYPATGDINDAALKQFDELYKKQLTNTTSVDVFDGDPMALDSLGIDDVQGNTTQE